MVYPMYGAGSQVRFSLENVVCPDLENILEKATSRLEVTGKVVMLSDAGKQERYYAVVEVGGIATPLIVPVDRLGPAETAETEATMASRLSSGGRR